MRHVNAEDVLPGELLRQVQRYCTGYVYVPSARAGVAELKRVIAAMLSEGRPACEIAHAVGRTARRVRQIAQELRAGA